MSTEQLRARRWTYAPDATNASRPSDNGRAQLTGELPPSRVQPKERWGLPPDWQWWMPVLGFTLRTERFFSTFEIERQNFPTWDDRRESETIFNLVWKIDYPGMSVAIDGGKAKPVSELCYLDWLEFDMLLLGLLGDWPTMPDEARWADSRKKVSRVIYAVAGYTAGTWNPRFTRTRDQMFAPSSAIHLGRPLNEFKDKQQPVSGGWQPAPDRRGIINTLTGSSLTYEGETPSPYSFPNGTCPLFTFVGAGFTLPIPALVRRDPFGAPVWDISVTKGILMAAGWTFAQIGGARSDEEWRVLSQALEDTAPTRANELAALVNGVIDAVLHWQPVDGADLPRPRALLLKAITNDGAYWPFEHISAALDPDRFQIFR